jgi:hypothetical protein
MPFCVSSFSSLIKGQGYMLVFPGRSWELGISVVCCVVFVAAILLVKSRARTIDTNRN